MYENLKFKTKTVIPTSIYFAHIDTLLNHYQNVLLMSEYDFQKLDDKFSFQKHGIVKS